MAKEPDPREVWSAFEAELGAAATPPPVVILRGAERWYRSRAVDVLVERARAAQFELCRHDTADPDFRAAKLLDDLSSSAMFATSRCIVLVEPDALLKKQAGDESPTARALLSFAKRNGGSIVLSAESLRADLSVVKALTQLGARTYTFRKLYERPGGWESNPDPRRTELVRWVVDRARERNVAVSPDQALLLAHARGNDLAALDDELAAAASAGGVLSVAGLSSASAGSPSDVADALIGGDLASAIYALETLFRGGIRRAKDGSRDTDEGALVAILLGYLRPRVRQGLAAAQLVEAGVKPDAAASQVGAPPFDKNLRAAIASRSTQAWRAMLDGVIELERRSKSARGVDATELATLALRWSPRASRANSAQRSGQRR